MPHRHRLPVPPVTVVATVGPALKNAALLRDIASLGHIIFRVNGAHGSITQTGATIRRIHRAVPGAKVLLDFPGRKIRITNLAGPIELKAGRAFKLARHQFTHSAVCNLLRKDQTLIANDGRTRLRVDGNSADSATLVSLDDGVILNNKGIHIGEALAGLPLLSARDHELMANLQKWPVALVGLSFVCAPEDIAEAKRLIARKRSRAAVVAKIETAMAMARLPDILACHDLFMLDRGDLASEIGLENLPAAQDRVLRDTLTSRVDLIVATQLLKSMEIHPIPVIAELTEIHRLLERGVFGLQLSEETAVGRHPIACVRLIMDMSRQLTFGAPRSHAPGAGRSSSAASQKVRTLSRKKLIR